MTTMTLRQLAARHGLLVGAAFNPHAFAQDPRYGEVLGREFNCVVAENVMKLHHLQPERGRFDFAAADAMLDFAAAHDMAARGHTLVWHNAVPAWLRDGDFSRTEMLDILEQHIFTVAPHFAGRIRAWDVVNEAVADGGDGIYRQNSIWHERVGPAFIAHAFRWAHEADPQAELFYNDYDVEWVDLKAARSLEVVRGLLDQGIAVHGIGAQYHSRAMDAPSVDDVCRRLEPFAQLGLKIHLTELDVKIPAAPTPEDIAQQSRAFADAFRVARRLPACEAVMLWGYTDRYSWIPSFTNGEYDHALIFDREFAPKACYHAICDVLRED